MINKKKGGLAKRYASSYEKKDGVSTSKGGVINYRNYDGDVTFFNPAEGKHRINIVPYIIKSKNHPLVKKGEAEIGEMDYVLDFYVHRGVGPAEKSVLCLKNTFEKPCPICEHSASLRKAGKEKEANALKPSHRVVYNIEDLKEPGKIKVFETSHYLFEKELIEEARDDENGGFVDFADPEEGKEIKFRASKATKNKIEFTEFKSFSFEDRDEELDSDLVESAISFDELLNVPTYEEVEKVLYGDDDSEYDNDEGEEKPSKKSKPKDDEDDEEKPSKKSKSKSDDEDDEEKPSKKSKPKDDEDDEEKPSKKSKSKSDDEEEDNEEGEEKPAKKNCGKDCGDCPFGHKFGKDCDEFSECDDCDIWDKCVKASE
jgi:hypothetical protein